MLIAPRFLVISMLALAATASLPSSDGRARRTTSPALAAAERLVLVGWVDPSAKRSEDLCLAGAWSRARGWMTPPKDLNAPEWRATQWQLYPGPVAAPIALHSRPVPHPAEGLNCTAYELAAPARGGVAVSGATRPRPRVARRYEAGRASLSRFTRELLSSHKIRPAGAPRIRDAWRVDLNGDGREEILWTARSRDEWRSPYADRPGGPRPGDYALLGLRHGDGKGARSVALALRTAGSDPAEYRVLCPLDINGDGRLEILAHARYFEEAELLAFTFDGKRVAGIFGAALPRRNRVD